MSGFRSPARARRTGPAARLLRLLPAALAAYELRYLTAHLAAFWTALHGAGSHSPSLFALALLAVGAALLLRESGRGVSGAVRRPRWSLRFAGTWMLCSAVLAALLFAAGAWPALPAVLLVGLVLAASLQGARSLLLQLVRRRQGHVTVSPPGLTLRVVSADERSAAAPLRAGWSDRGPPAAALATL